MIQKSLCTRCFQAYVITIEAGDKALYAQMQDDGSIIKNLISCPRKCGGFITPLNSDDIRLKAPVFAYALSLTVPELYKAVNGAGLPDEVPKDLDAINALLLVHRVNETMLEEVGRQFLLHGLKLSNGFTIHLGCSPKGPCIVKITKEAPDGSGNHR